MGSSIRSHEHNVLAQLLQEISDQDKVQIETVRITWDDVSTIDGTEYRVSHVAIESFSSRPEKKSG